MGKIRACPHCEHTIFGNDLFCPWCGKDPDKIEMRYKIPSYQFLVTGQPMEGRCPGCGLDLDQARAQGYEGHLCGTPDVLVN